MRHVFVMEKEIPAAVVASIERRRPFINANDTRKGGKKREYMLEAAGRKNENAW
jgi:hypothetical protein